MASRDINLAHPTLKARFLAAKRLFNQRKWARERYEIRISCVRRSTEEQMNLYAQGRDYPGAIVTYCDGVRLKSMHQDQGGGFSRAIDFFVVKKSDGLPVWRWNVAMMLFVFLCDGVGLECGRFWTMKDSFHVQMYENDR